MHPCSKGNQQYLGYISKCITSSWREAVLPLYSALVGHQSIVSGFGLPSTKKNMDLLEQVQ